MSFHSTVFEMALDGFDCTFLQFSVLILDRKVWRAKMYGNLMMADGHGRLFVTTQPHTGQFSLTGCAASNFSSSDHTVSDSRIR